MKLTKLTLMSLLLLTSAPSFALQVGDYLVMKTTIKQVDKPVTVTTVKTLVSGWDEKKLEFELKITMITQDGIARVEFDSISEHELVDNRNEFEKSSEGCDGRNQNGQNGRNEKIDLSGRSVDACKIHYEIQGFQGLAWTKNLGLTNVLKADLVDETGVKMLLEVTAYSIH